MASHFAGECATLEGSFAREHPGGFIKLLVRSAPLPFALGAAVVILSLATTLGMTMQEREHYFSEEGPVEFVTAGVLLAAAGSIALGALLTESKLFCLHSAVIYIVMGLRELDFQNRFTETGVLRTKYFVRHEAPIIETILVGGILLFILFAIVIYAVRYFPLFWKGAFSGVRWVWFVGVGMAFLAASQSVDRAGYWLTRSESGPKIPIEMVHSAEEPLELSGASLLLISTWLYIRWVRRGWALQQRPSVDR